MKKYVFALILAAMLTGCGSQSADNDELPAETTAAVTDAITTAPAETTTSSASTASTTSATTVTTASATTTASTTTSEPEVSFSVDDAPEDFIIEDEPKEDFLIEDEPAPALDGTDSESTPAEAPAQGASPFAEAYVPETASEFAECVYDLVNTSLTEMSGEGLNIPGFMGLRETWSVNDFIIYDDTYTYSKYTSVGPVLRFKMMTKNPGITFLSNMCIQFSVPADSSDCSCIAVAVKYNGSIGTYPPTNGTDYTNVSDAVNGALATLSAS